jgi:hypothetical protein
MIPRAREPFRFYTQLSLTFMTGRRARTLAELLEGLRAAPDSVVYQHTHRFLQQQQHLVPEPPNDFAYWVGHILQDEGLGERLAAVDTVRFSAIGDLRASLASTVEEHLRRGGEARRAPEGKEFHFMDAWRLALPTPHEAGDLAEFSAELRRVTLGSLYYHIFEAKLRPPLGVNDFSYWMESQLGEKKLAGQIASLDPYTRTLEGLRARILELIGRRLKEETRGSA